MAAPYNTAFTAPGGCWTFLPDHPRTEMQVSTLTLNPLCHIQYNGIHKGSVFKHYINLDI